MISSRTNLKGCFDLGEGLTGNSLFAQSQSTSPQNTLVIPAPEPQWTIWTAGATLNHVTKVSSTQHETDEPPVPPWHFWKKKPRTKTKQNLDLKVRLPQTNPNPGTFCKTSPCSSKLSVSRTTKGRPRSCSRLKGREDTRQPKIWHGLGLKPGSRGKKKKSLKWDNLRTASEFEYTLCVRLC